MDRGIPSPAGSAWLRPVFCTGIGLVGNAILSAAKIAIGLLAGSAALVADGFHSLADVLSDIGILLALKAANRPPDENHPYGHHSFETLGAVVVAAFMLLTALLIGGDAVRGFLKGVRHHPEKLALGAAIVSIVTKEIMARYTIHVGRLHNSPALLANGAMHRSDAISSIAAALGIVGAMIRWPVLDNIAALVIAVFIAKMGWDLLHENVMTLMDTMPDPALVASIRRAASAVEGVQEIRDLRVRQRGSWYLADLRIAVHPDLSLGAAHDIAHGVEDRVRDNVGNVARVFVHVEPGERTGVQPAGSIRA
ncbi:MAG TPA: cation diffusion facilitator family transporter [Candidatus Krumholzibacteria bacterium]|nr:cation diffusion facilitator family transporter [Candidatus Krumholzibacteria bacterium]